MIELLWEVMSTQIHSTVLVTRSIVRGWNRTGSATDGHGKDSLDAQSALPIRKGRRKAANN